MITETKPDQLLVNILSTRRADQSAGDTNFRLWLHAVLQSMKANTQILSRGNIFVTVGNSKTLFSCHIDTCHSVAESTGQMQEIEYDPHMEHIFLPAKSNSSCLGADDGVGIYIMLKMIQANVPGGYMFHTGEERGGLGAKEVLKHHYNLLKNYTHAIAFDRPDNDEVIITQGGVVCASVVAGSALCSMLEKHGLKYEISHKGVFTDTKIYAPVIPECFNIGVGYAFQHTPNETLDYGHVKKLLAACIAIKWQDIPTVRKIPINNPLPFPKPKPKPTESVVVEENFDDLPWEENVYEDLFNYTLDDFEELVEQSPFTAASNMALLVSKVSSMEAEIKQLHKIMGIT